MNTPQPFQEQLLATKFFIPVSSHPVILRPRLTDLLNKSLQSRFTLISAQAGFGKTTLLSAWVQSLPEATAPHVAWISLDESDNEPIHFWDYVLTALEQQMPNLCPSLLAALHAPQAPPLHYILQTLTTKLAERNEHSLLILDDYHLISQQEIHQSLAFLLEHLPAQLHLIIATRTDLPFQLPASQSPEDSQEIRAEQLRCTTEEAAAFLKDVMALDLPESIIKDIVKRTDGWLVGIQLLGLTLQGSRDPAEVLHDLSGDQRYILDYLTEEVLHHQPPKIQKFLLYTSILERLTTSLCNAVLVQKDSQQMLEQLEHANLFVVSLDTQHRWYRYHALFAEALRTQLAQTETEIIPTLHSRASEWFSEHHLFTEAILHAFNAHEWKRATKLIEQLPISLAWGSNEQHLVMLRQWLEQLPEDIVRSRPTLCLACAQIMRTVAPQQMLQGWLDAAERTLVDTLNNDADEPLTSEQQREQENLLGEVLAFRAYLISFQTEGEKALPIIERALKLLSPQNILVRSQVSFIQLLVYYTSVLNDAATGLHHGLQSISQVKEANNEGLTNFFIGATSCYLLGAGQLHKVQQMTEYGLQFQQNHDLLAIHEEAWSLAMYADVLREWNQLDEALKLILQAIAFARRSSTLSLLLNAYSVLIHTYLSRQEWDEAQAALAQFDAIGSKTNHYLFSLIRSHFTIVDQARLWLARGEFERASRWAKDLERSEQSCLPYTREREEVACVRILLAQQYPTLALRRLQPLIIRATTSQRWNHALEMWLLQAQAHQMCQEEDEALAILTRAVRYASTEGYIRRFVDEGAIIAALLTTLRNQEQRTRPTPYLDTLLTAFPPETLPAQSSSAPTSNTEEGHITSILHNMRLSSKRLFTNRALLKPSQDGS